MSTGDSPLLGIDLGTTNSLIAVWQDGQARLIPNALGDVLTPSVISLDEDDTILVGKAARARLTTHPERTAAAFKRFMGSDKRFTLGDRQFTPEELSALVLGSLKHDAEAFLGCAVHEAVISVPAYFSDEQRKRTVFAAELAGLKVQRLINEGQITEEEANVHPQSNLLTACLGAQTEPPCPIHRIGHLEVGDTLLVCSDGLWHYFTPKELGAIVHTLPPREAAEMLVTKARHRARGGGDNLSLALVRVEALA